MIAVIYSLLILSILFNQAESNTTLEISVESSPLTQFIPQPSIPPTPTITPTPALPPPPPAMTLSGGTQIFQSFNNCGPAALSMALSHYGINQSQAVLGQALRPYQNPAGDNDDKSVTLSELAAYAPEFDLIPYHRPAGNIDIIKQFINLEVPVLARTWLKPDEDIGHYRVITGFDDTKGILIQDDSLQGADLSYSYQEFEQLWEAFNYEFLVLIPSEKRFQAEHILGDLLDEQTAWQQAYTMNQMAISQNPTNIYAQFNSSVAAYHLGKYQESIEYFEAIQDKLPSRMLWYQIEPLLSYFQLEQYQLFLELSQNIITNQNLAFSELHYVRGKVFEKQGRYSQADESFQLANTYNHPQGYWLTNIQ